MIDCQTKIIISLMICFLIVYVKRFQYEHPLVEYVSKNIIGQKDVPVRPPKPKSLTFEKEWIRRSNGQSMYVDEFYVQNVTTMKEVSPVNWSNVVIFITIYESSKIDQLIKAHFKTWLKHTDEGLDVVFVTDKSDERSIEEILPDAKNVSSTSHVYKSPADFDGKHIRFKIIDSLKEMEHLFL